MAAQKFTFVVSSLDFESPQRFSATKLISYLRSSGNWPDASIHDPAHQFPFMNIEFHGRAGFSMLCFEKPSSVGHLASRGSTLSEPSILVCLGGQVIEKWPKELFLSASKAKTVVSHFLKTGKQHPGLNWVRLDRFRRTTVHPGGKGLIPLWQRLRENPEFPFTSDAT